jgi:hypothetical protein
MVLGRVSVETGLAAACRVTCGACVCVCAAYRVVCSASLPALLEIVTLCDAHGGAAATVAAELVHSVAGAVNATTAADAAPADLASLSHTSDTAR